ncbi:TlpA family protein disulfide reductase [Peptoniphilus sp. MSJ-1]|uniref:TlpA family protein disulfide reductase n=1 Tax=Peptoniphilus ovalis TaxID=2841503 RepID=A0ABS6FHV8_9FIRM|nr:TlpA disulfide reductase family protein [Peptoniphilus ovalis]MBU5668820.1 TlpA family protein disulfide reductase [Peptoniphilus ovalis]
MKNMFKKLSILMAICFLAMSFAACSKEKSEDTASTDNKFPSFTGVDMNGNKVNEEIFKDHAVTVVNMWFTGCKACIMEMPDLEKKSKEWKEKDVNLLGICADIQDNEEIRNEAKKILASKGVTYTNISLDNGEEIDKFMTGITTFPSTFLVDRNGNIIGDPILGTINGEKASKEIEKRIDEIIANDKK